MPGCLLRGRSMSQRLSVLLLLFGLAWCLMLLHYTVTQPRHQSSTELRQQILELSQRYVKALSTENQELAGAFNPSMAGFVKSKGRRLRVTDRLPVATKVSWEMFFQLLLMGLCFGVLGLFADLKRTIAVLLDDILNRLGKLENRLDTTMNTSVHSSSHVTGMALQRPFKQSESGTNAHSNQPQPLT